MSASDIAVSVRGLSKAYTIAHNQERHVTLAETLLARAKNPFKRAKREVFWALNDVSFDILKGDAVGIIGRNGAGKSTLLKTLSRITEPTRGEIEIKGRIGSLLEVGTGFHPELTGRENVFLNGAILGMSKTEIRKQFDAIVDFAGVAKFLDTPVKRYSSGMYVRLAFAVAAHLRTEILIVDEVLSVGDMEFQKRCMGKMQDVSASEGRTVILVSHNISAIKSLCRSALLLEQGKVAQRGRTGDVIETYMASSHATTSTILWDSDAPGDDSFQLKSVSATDNMGRSCAEFSSNQDIHISITFNVSQTLADLCIGFDLVTNDEGVVLRTYQTDASIPVRPDVDLGTNMWTCTIPAGLLNAGTYTISPRVGIHNVKWIVHIDPVISFNVSLDHSDSAYWRGLTRNSRPGCVAPVLEWQTRHRALPKTGAN